MMSTTTSNAKSNVTFPAQKRDLIDASTVTDSLNALPGFKTSAGECLFFPFYFFLLPATCLIFREGGKEEAAAQNRGRFPLARRTTGPEKTPTVQQSNILLDSSEKRSSLAVVSRENSRARDIYSLAKPIFKALVLFRGRSASSSSCFSARDHES